MYQKSRDLPPPSRGPTGTPVKSRKPRVKRAPSPYVKGLAFQIYVDTPEDFKKLKRIGEDIEKEDYWSPSKGWDTPGIRSDLEVFRKKRKKSNKKRSSGGSSRRRSARRR